VSGERAIFRDGRYVADAPDDLEQAYAKLREVGRGKLGFEVRRRCPNHPNLYSIVDCTVCDPIGAAES
jgi:hypothetical protein